MDIKKLILATVLVVLLSLGAYGYFNYYQPLFGGSELDGKDTTQQIEALTTQEQYKDLPEVIELKNQLQQSGEKATTDNTTLNQVAPVPTQQQLENELTQKLQGLQEEYNGKLQSLLASAAAEYKQLRAQKQGASLNDVAQKYIALGTELETECDARAYATIAYTQNELDKYQYNSNIIEQAKQTYMQSKEARRKAMLGLVADKL